MKSLLWIDSRGGLTVGALVLIFAAPLSRLYSLPLALIVVMGLANIAYGSFSFTLERRATRPRGLLLILIAANAGWALLCVVTASLVAEDASPLGIASLALEAGFVGGLAVLEWRSIERLIAGG